MSEPSDARREAAAKVIWEDLRVSFGLAREDWSDPDPAVIRPKVLDCAQRALDAADAVSEPTPRPNAEIGQSVAPEDEMLSALRYIAQPTMGYPGTEGGPWEDLTPPTLPDPEWWVRNGYGTDANIRLALATCIAQAKAALKKLAAGEPLTPPRDARSLSETEHERVAAAVYEGFGSEWNMLPEPTKQMAWRSVVVALEASESRAAALEGALRALIAARNNDPWSLHDDATWADANGLVAESTHAAG